MPGDKTSVSHRAQTRHGFNRGWIQKLRRSDITWFNFIGFSIKYFKLFIHLVAPNNN